MKFYFGLCLTLFIFLNNISYGNNHVCDNNSGDREVYSQSIETIPKQSCNQK